MGANNFQSDKNQSWQTTPYRPYYENNPAPGRPGNSSTTQQSGGPQQPGAPGRVKPPARMPKARALELVSTFKRGLIVVSLTAFASFSGLVAFHQIGMSGTTTGQKSHTTVPATPTATPSSEDGGNSFFNQQGGDNLGTATPSASNGSNSSSQGASNGSNSSSSGPVSGSGVS